MSLTRTLAFLLATSALVLLGTVTIHAQASSVCQDSSQATVNDAQACLRELIAQWNAFAQDMASLLTQVNDAESLIAKACDAIGQTDCTPQPVFCLLIKVEQNCVGCPCPSIDIGQVKQNIEQAIQSLQLALSRFAEITYDMSNFRTLLASFAAKLGELHTDFSFRDRIRTATQRRLETIDRISRQTLVLLLGRDLVAGGDGLGLEGEIYCSIAILEDAKTQLEQGQFYRDTVLDTLSSAKFGCIKKGDIKALNRKLSQVRRELDRLSGPRPWVPILINGPRNASRINFNNQTQIFTLAGTSVTAVDPVSSALQLANGVYVLIKLHSDGHRELQKVAIVR